MAMLFRCNEVVPGCAAEIRGETQDEVMRQVAAHVREVHRLPMDSETTRKLKAAIRAE